MSSRPLTPWEAIQAKTFSTTHIGKTETRATSRVFNVVKEKAKGRVLDVGCGDGGVVAALVESGVDATGVDLADVVQVATERHPGLKFHGGDVREIDWSFWEPYETILSMDTVEHVEDDLGFLRCLGEIAPKVIITTPSNVEKWREQREHLRWYAPVAMARLLAIAGMVMTEHVRVWEESTNIFVAERSSLPLEERLRLSVAAAKEPPTSMHMRPQDVTDLVEILAPAAKPNPDWGAPVWQEAYNRMGNLFDKSGIVGKGAAIVGAAGGSLADALLRLGWEVILVDMDLFALGVARTVVGPKTGARKVTYVLGDPKSHVLENLDLVVCHGLDHEPDPLAAVRAVKDSLTQRGSAAFLVAHPDSKVLDVMPGETPTIYLLLTLGGPAYGFGRLRTYTESQLREIVGTFMDVVSTAVVRGKDAWDRDEVLTIAVARRHP